jgi:hypothetical protein
VITPVSKRLLDQRWYFVRNLVNILRQLNDPNVLEPLGRLAGYPHAKVQSEVIKVFRQYRHPQTDRYLLRQLSSENTAVRFAGIRLSGQSSDPDVALALTDLLNSKGLSENDYGMKKAVLTALGEMRHAAALPGLISFFKSRSLLHPLQHNQLKNEVVSILEQYDGESLLPLLKSISGQLPSELEPLYEKLSGGEDGSGAP